MDVRGDRPAADPVGLRRGETGPDLGISDPPEGFARRPDRTERGEASLGVAAMPRDVTFEHRPERIAIDGIESTPFDQDILDRPVLGDRPRPDRLDQRISADEVELKRENAEQQVPIGVP